MFNNDLLLNFRCIQNMLRSIHSEGLHNHQECKNYIGKMFRVKFYECPEWWSDGQIADFILQRCILIHLNNAKDKFNLLVFMTKKLFSFSQDKCKVEGADAVMMQELLLGKNMITLVSVMRGHSRFKKLQLANISDTDGFTLKTSSQISIRVTRIFINVNFGWCRGDLINLYRFRIDLISLRYCYRLLQKYK